MPITGFSCPSCKASLKLPHVPKGKIKCPKCKAAFLPPSTEPLTEQVQLPPPSIPETQSDYISPSPKSEEQGQGKLEALNGARRDLMRSRREANGVAHPFFWASFVLVGDPS